MEEAGGTTNNHDRHSGGTTANGTAIGDVKNTGGNGGSGTATGGAPSSGRRWRCSWSFW